MAPFAHHYFKNHIPCKRRYALYIDGVVALSGHLFYFFFSFFPIYTS